MLAAPHGRYLPNQTIIMTTETRNFELRLKQRPGSDVSPDDFTLGDSPIEAPQAGQVLVKVEWLSMDTYLYERTIGDAMGPAIPLGSRMPGRALGTVVSGGLPAGTLVSGDFGWQKYATVDASAATALERNAAPDTWYLSALGAPGLTAWLALHKVLKPAAGKTLLVSGAAGTVGSLVGQLARELGLNVIGIAGGAERCKWLMQHGYQAVIDRKTVTDWKQAMLAAAPNGIDFYYDNAGGRILEAAVQAIAPGGRIVLCGHSGEYTSPTAKLTATDLLYKGLTLHGFRVWDFTAQFKEARAALLDLIIQKKLHMEETIHHGLASAPAAMDAMLNGNGLGKHLVKVHED